MHFNTLLYSFMIKIIVTKAQVKNINIRMLNSTCVDKCHNYQFAICFPGSCSKFSRLQAMLDKNTCFYIYNRTFGGMVAKVKEPELINNVTFAPINKQISKLGKMILMVYDTDPSPTKLIFCEKKGSRNLTKNGISVTFAYYYTPASTMRFEILIEAVCEKEDCHGEMCDICGTTTELLPTTDISTSMGKTTHLSMKTTHSTGHTRDTSNFTIIQSTTHANTKSDVTSTSATTTQLLPTTDGSTSGDTTTTRLSTQTTYSTGHPGNTTNRPSPTNQSEKYTANTAHSNTKTDIASTSHISTLTKMFSAKTTSNATTPAISKRSTSHGITTSSNAKNSLSKTVIINEEVENSKNVRAWAITTTAVGIVEIIIIVLLIVYIRRLKIQKRTASSSQECMSYL